MVCFSEQVLTGRSSGTVIPPPLVRGGQQVSSKHGSQIIMPPLVRGAQVSHVEMLTMFKIIFLNICQVSARLLCTISETNCREIFTLKRDLWSLFAPFSVCVCPLPWCFWCPSPVLHCVCLWCPSMSSLSLSWLAHLCISTADPGSPSATAAAVGCLWRFRTPAFAVGPEDLSPCRPERHGPARPYQGWQQCEHTGQYLRGASKLNT